MATNTQKNQSKNNYEEQILELLKQILEELKRKNSEKKLTSEDLMK